MSQTLTKARVISKLGTLAIEAPLWKHGDTDIVAGAMTSHPGVKESHGLCVNVEKWASQASFKLACLQFQGNCHESLFGQDSGQPARQTPEPCTGRYGSLAAVHGRKVTTETEAFSHVLTALVEFSARLTHFACTRF